MKMVSIINEKSETKVRKEGTVMIRSHIFLALYILPKRQHKYFDKNSYFYQTKKKDEKKEKHKNKKNFNLKQKKTKHSL